jgi:predicted nucleotidyltransferase
MVQINPRWYTIFVKALVKSDIVEFLKNNSQTINAFGVRKIGLFGSFAKNKQAQNSDIDILVEFNTEYLTYENYINLAYYLEDNLDRKIDLITADSLSPYIGPHILKEVEYVSL